jgi:threonine synthase
MSEAIDRFTAEIDEGFDASQSVVLRYRHAVRFEGDEQKDLQFKQQLESTSLSEGLRVVPLMEYRGVSIDVLDESSLMATGTLKSIDGCIAAAKSHVEGFDRCVFESGGNTGSALTKYGECAGFESYFVVPAENLSLLDSSIFERPDAHLIAVDDPREVKPSAARLAALEGLRRIPEATWRIQASTLIGCFVLEHFLGITSYDFMVQSISAAFGPIGIYKVLSAGLGSDYTLPRFVGIQQAANCPMYRAWRRQSPEILRPVQSTSQLLTRVMYDSEPHTYGTFEKLDRLLTETGGHLDIIDHDEFFGTLNSQIAGQSLIEHLENSGIQIGLRDGEVIEKTGLISLIGTLKQIDRGRVAPGARVLVCFTGGTACPDGLAVPDVQISNSSQIDKIFGHQSKTRQGNHG